MWLPGESWNLGGFEHALDEMTVRLSGTNSECSFRARVRQVRLADAHCMPRSLQNDMAHGGELRQTARVASEDSIVGVKFEGEPPFDLGVAQTVSAQVLDATVVLRVTVVVPEIRSKPVPVRFTMTAELARAFLGQFGTVVTMAELHRRQRPFS
jgi:hypothetical protein